MEASKATRLILQRPTKPTSPVAWATGKYRTGEKKNTQNRAGKQASTFSVSITDASETFGVLEARHPGQVRRLIIIIIIWTNFHILR